MKHNEKIVSIEVNYIDKNVGVILHVKHWEMAHGKKISSFPVLP